MKIFVINLKKDKEKLNNILLQFKKYNITDYEIIEAVQGSQLTDEELLEKYDKIGQKEFLENYLYLK